MNVDYENNIRRNITLSILINAILPLITYKILVNHMPSITALMISTTIPVIDNIYHIIKNKKLDILATFIILGFVVGIISMLFTGNQRLLLIRQSYITAVMGIVFLVSMLFPKPIIYYFADKFLNPPNKNNEGKNSKSIIEEKWKNPRFRFSMKFITFVWGTCLLLEAICNISLVFVLSISEYMAISPFISYGFIGCAFFITFAYRKRMKAKSTK
ncbi:MAG: VC0807 family protein [Clostridium perfringens]|nr:VC0807 family protein [Clostridium perfringens]